MILVLDLENLSLIWLNVGVRIYVNSTQARQVPAIGMQ